MYNSGGPLTFPANLYPVPIFFMHSVLFVCLFYQQFIGHLQQFSLDTWLLLPSPRLACYDQSFPSSSPPFLRCWPWMRYLPFYVVHKPRNKILSHITKKRLTNDYEYFLLFSLVPNIGSLSMEKLLWGSLTFVTYSTVCLLCPTVKMAKE